MSSKPSLSLGRPESFSEEDLTVFAESLYNQLIDEKVAIEQEDRIGSETEKRKRPGEGQGAGGQAAAASAG